MSQPPPIEFMTTMVRERGEIKAAEETRVDENVRPTLHHGRSDPIPSKITDSEMEVLTDGISHSESRNVIEETILPFFYRASYTPVSGGRDRAIGESPSQSTPSFPNTNFMSPTISPGTCTPANYDRSKERKRATAGSRLKSSISMKPPTMDYMRRAAVQPSEFRLPPEEPEKRFVDEIGMVFPGVCDRQQCTRSHVHFVTSFRLCEPMEYTTALADHGLTYTDYCRLINALWGFLHKTRKGKKRRKYAAGSIAIPSAEADVFKSPGVKPAPSTLNSFWDTTEQLKKNKQEAVELNKLLDEITCNLQARGVSVMVGVASFSLFAPSRVSEAHIEITHVSREQTLQAALEPATNGKPSQRMGQRLSFIDVLSFAACEPRSTLEPQAKSATETTRCGGDTVCGHAQDRDRSKPYALWPDTIPLRKRQTLSANIERYGVDPYFRAWMRATINAGTRCSTYTKYLVEREDNPLVNRRIQYADAALDRDIVAALLRDDRAWKGQFPSTVNRAKYEHNRRLECRKTVEQGFRVRILRFGFRHPVYPPHTPEMETLGLTKQGYSAILASFDRMHSSIRLNTRCPGIYMVASLNKVRRMGTEDALVKAREYIRRLNASQRKIVWTIEKIPWVYDKGWGRNRAEWEISAWNAEDPLELLMQLERWGIIENRLSLDDED